MSAKKRMRERMADMMKVGARGASEEAAERVDDRCDGVSFFACVATALEAPPFDLAVCA